MKKIRSSVVLFWFIIALQTVPYAQVKDVSTVGFTVKDMNRSVKFYTEVLGFEKISDEELYGESIEQLNAVFGIHLRIVRMKLGDEIIELTDYLTTGGRSIPETAQSNDLSFQHIAIVVSDMEKAFAQLRKHNIEFVSTLPQTLPKTIPQAEGIKAFYFHDPDNHNLEIIFFPKGKGQEKWQAPNGKIFLGIDHTAIGISNTEKSHAFYNTILGIERKGDSWNKGTEQEHLNNVKNASLHITGYRAAKGIGVEFLQYLVPGSGKPYPTDTRTDDLWYWQTTFVVDDAHAVFTQLKTSGFQTLSQEPVHLSLNKKHSIAFIAKDPDGHAVLIVQHL
jgi:catechol 2,3-dioxygenase-like lactoylglutathione lyase family enzyme